MNPWRFGLALDRELPDPALCVDLVRVSIGHGFCCNPHPSLPPIHGGEPVFHHHFFQALAPHNPLFFEEVLVHGQNPALAKAISNRTDVPLATGERMFTIEEFRDLFESRAVNIVQPDCSHAGGISHMLTIARLAEAYEVSFAPHW